MERQFFFALSLTLLFTAGQTLVFGATDDLESLISEAKQALESRDDPKALRLAEKAETLANTLNRPLALAESREVKGIALRRQSEWVAAYLNLENALKYWESAGDSLRVAVVCREIAITKDRESADLENGIYYALRAIYILRGRDDARRHYGNALMILGNLRRSADQLDSAKGPLHEAIAVFEALPDTVQWGTAHYGLGQVFYHLDSMEQARRHLATAVRLFRHSGSLRRLAMAYNLLGAVHYDVDSLQQAETYYRRSLELARTLDASLLIFDAYCNLSLLAYYQDQYPQALSLIQQAEQALGKLGGKRDSIFIYEQYADVYSGMGRHQEAENYLRELLRLEREVYREQVAAASENFKTELLSRELAVARAERQEQANWNYFLSALAGALLLAVILVGYIARVARYNARKRQEVHLATMQYQGLKHQREIENLIANAQIKTQSAQLSGIRQERTRISKLLHDSVSSQLVATRWMQEESINAFESRALEKNDLERVLEMLTKAYDEVRTLDRELSHPKDSWIRDIEEFCRVVQKSRNIDLHLNLGQLPKVVSPEMGEDIKNMAYTLLANALLHADAQRIAIDLCEKEGYIQLRIADDGKGFDTGQLVEKEGNGFRYVRARVKDWQGTYDIRSAPNAGTAISVILPLMGNN